MIMKRDVAIIGAGTAGLYALRAVRRAGKSFVLIDHGPLGTTCARVGCMPSKVALHMAAQWRTVTGLGNMGVRGMEHLTLDRGTAWKWLKRQRDGFADAAESKARDAAGTDLLEGRARFTAPDRLVVELNAGGRREIQAKSIVVATGSRPVVPSWLDDVRDRVITTDDLFQLDAPPASIGILGLGAIGLEMGLALARLGVRVTAADVAGTIGGMGDGEVAARAVERLGSEFQMWLQTAARISRDGNGLLMQADDGRRAKVAVLLAALGRRPNIDGLDLEAAGAQLDPRGVPMVDPETLQIGGLPIFLAGDATGSRTLMHEAAEEGEIAGANAVLLVDTPVLRPQAFQRKTPLGIAFTDPDLASVGARLNELDASRIVIGSAQGRANGRARILGEPDSLLRVYADKNDGRLLGAALLAADGEHLAHLLAWAIQRGETASSLLQMPFYHPVMEELVQTALQDAVRQLRLQSASQPGHR